MWMWSSEIHVYGAGPVPARHWNPIAGGHRGPALTVECNWSAKYEERTNGPEATRSKPSKCVTRVSFQIIEIIDGNKVLIERCFAEGCKY